MDELGRSLRAWRDRLSPAAVGLPEQPLRRAPGLRREELAQLAGVSIDYLSRLEQGRAVNPSPQVLEALARALRLSATEREHLFRAAGHVAVRRINRELTPGVQRVLDRFADVPVLVIDPAWTIVQRNAIAAALTGEPEETNVIVAHFLGGGSRVVRDEHELALLEREMVSDLHAALASYPDDPELVELIASLRAGSERFEALWQSQPPRPHSAARKTFDHPEVGLVTLDCDRLSVEGSDLRLIVHTAEPDSPAAAALLSLAAAVRGWVPS